MSGQASVSQDLFDLNISLSRDVFPPGEPIWVRVVFENVSSTEQEYGAQSKDFDYILYCVDEQGGTVPPTLFGVRMAGNRGRGRYIRSVLGAGQQLINEILVSRHLDLSLVGKYSLRLTRDVFPNTAAHGPTIASNVCLFEISE